jgi:YHS domain-containing protein
MKNVTLYALSMALGMLLLAGCGDQAQEKLDADGAPEATPVKIAQQTCPVMEGNKINPKLFADHKGRRIYFCCPGCNATFQKDPEKYIKKVDAELASLKAGSGEKDEHAGHGH